MDNIQNMFAERIGGIKFGTGTEIYKFEKIKAAKRQAEINDPDRTLIDLGVGEPDEMADLQIVKTLYENAQKWENRGYADNGILEFQEAAAKYLSEVYGVRGINPQTEVLHVIGSKSVLAFIPYAFINPGDITIMTVPGYPIMGTVTKWLGGYNYELPLTESRKFLPDLNSIPEGIRKKAKLLYINYPNNPTGAIATYDFFEQVVEFAKQNNIIVVHDAAYGALTFDDVKPLSFLSVPGARETGIEVHSLSKAFNMTGWRLGFISGNEKMIKAIAMVKDNNDSGQFKAIQKAGIYALSHPELTKKYCEKYWRRHNKLAGIFTQCGFKVNVPKATFYEYIKIPKGTKSGIVFNSADEFMAYLIKEVKISVVPWDDAGKYFRASVTFIANTLSEEEQILDEIKRRLMKCQFVF